MSETDTPMILPGSIRRSIERSAEDYKNSVGMHVDTGKHSFDVSHVMYLLAFADKAVDALSAERAKNARLVAELDNAWAAFRQMRTLHAEAKYGDRLQNQVIAMKETP